MQTASSYVPLQITIRENKIRIRNVQDKKTQQDKFYGDDILKI